MAVKMRMDAVKGLDNIIDVSKFTEMEVEHGHDTAGRVGANTGVHAAVPIIDELTRDYHSENKTVRDAAMAHTLSSRI